MEKLPFECKNIQLNPLIERINYLLSKVAELEAKKAVEVPAILKPVAQQATIVAKKATTKAKS